MKAPFVVSTFECEEEAVRFEVGALRSDVSIWSCLYFSSCSSTSLGCLGCLSCQYHSGRTSFGAHCPPLWWD